MNAPPTDERGSEGEDEGGGLELTDAAENYCAVMLQVREAAAARGLTFREVMMAMGKLAIEGMEAREWADGDTFNAEDMTMAIAQKIGGVVGVSASGATPSLNGGMKTPEQVLRPLIAATAVAAAAATLPKGIEMGIGMPPASIEKKPTGKVNPLLPFIVTLAIEGWVKFDTAEHSRRLVACALTAAKKSMPKAEFERRFSVDGKCVVIVRKK